MPEKQTKNGNRKENIYQIYTKGNKRGNEVCPYKKINKTQRTTIKRKGGTKAIRHIENNHENGNKKPFHPDNLNANGLNSSIKRQSLTE